ncbi:MAG: LuxR C-terminal-related transcriptional regulator [Bacteroidetes bacterium]|nr:LuxR C-terminal-related transcriptional regulator [Bacteroidota bacterium]
MKLPTGIDKLIEINRFENGEVTVTVKGSQMDYLELPLILREPFQAELISDSAALKSLKENFKIFDADEMEYKFVSCRYAAYNGNMHHHPEIDSEGSCCSEIKTCPAFNILCKIPVGKNGILSRQEFLITVLVSKGKLDKEIADELNIEISTIRTYLARIREKLCVNNRIEIAFWAINHGIIWRKI